MKNYITVVRHSRTKFAWNVINTALGGKHKIAVVPYVAIDVDDEADPLRKEAENIARFISEAFNKNQI